MASSNLMMKMSSDLIRRKSSNSSSSSSSNHHHHHHLNNNNNHNHNHNHPSIISHNSGVFSMSVDGLSRNNEQEISLLDAAGAITATHETVAAGTISRQESVRTSCNGGGKTVDDVWKEIVGCKQEEEELMTLEDFLAKAGAVEVEQEDVKIPLASIVDGGGRKRRALLEEPLDKAAHQRQRRMIKNRESAARSRERKQAYQAELESLALKLQEENDMLLKEKAERTRKRYMQLIDKIIPIIEKGREVRRRRLRKVRSMEW